MNLPTKAFLSGLLGGSLLFGSLATLKREPAQASSRGTLAWVAVNGLWIRCDPSRAEHSEQAVRWSLDTHVAEIKEQGRWQRSVYAYGVGVETPESSLQAPPNDGKTYALVAKAGFFEIGGRSLQLLSSYEPIPRSQRLFRGHAPIGFRPGDDTFNIDWYTYSFQDDWATVVQETKREYGAQGYEPWNTEPGWAPSGFRHEWIAYRRGLYIAMSLAIELDSIQLIKDCRLTRDDDLPNQPRAPGWITVIIAHPHRPQLGGAPNRSPVIRNP